MEILSGASLFLRCMFLIQFLYKIIGNPLWSLPPPQVHVSYSVLIQIKEILFGASLLLQCMFLIQFLFKIDENPHWGLPPPPVHVSSSNPIYN